MPKVLLPAIAIGAVTFTLAPHAATNQPIRPSAAVVMRCTVAEPTSRASLEIQMRYAPDFCELIAQAIAGDVFHTRLLVTPGATWHYPGATVSCRLRYRSARELITVRNSADTCDWFKRHNTDWKRETPN